MVPNNMQLTQRAPILTVEHGMPVRRRTAFGLAGLFAALIAMLGAFDALNSGEPGLFPVGLGRLTDYLLEQGMPGAGLLAFLERGHFAVMLLIGALLLLFGRSAPPNPGAGQRVIFHRRASIRRQLPALFAGLGLVVVGAWIAGAIHPLLAGLVELPATMLIGWVLWYAIIPEMRVAVSVIVDDRQGFGNRIEIAGGTFNKLGTVTILHDQLEQASVVEPTWTRLFQYRDLQLFLNGRGGLRVNAIAPPAELADLTGYLNGDFIYGISRTGIIMGTRMPMGMGGHWA